MKLRNKKTGDIVEFLPECIYNSIAELKEDWEDYEEPKDHWHIGCEGDVFIDNTERYLKSYSSIGNDFKTKEEAEQAVEKLKAWKRLKDAGCKIVGWDYSDNVDLNGCKFNDDDFIIGLSAGDIDEEDLDLLFGGEDDYEPTNAEINDLTDMGYGTR